MRCSFLVVALFALVSEAYRTRFAKKSDAPLVYTANGPILYFKQLATLLLQLRPSRTASAYNIPMKSWEHKSRTSLRDILACEGTDVEEDPLERKRTDISTDKISPKPLAFFTTYAGLIANPIAIASLYTLQRTGCGLPRGPFGVFGVLETLSYFIVLGIVFSWTPKGGGFGSAGIQTLENSDGDKSQEFLQGAVELASWIVFFVGFLLFVQSIIAPASPVCFGDTSMSMESVVVDPLSF